MTPVNLDGCFGWLHLPRNGAKKTGMVLCPGLKTDDLNGYGSLKILADALADQGHPVLRIHYTHTGDSGELHSDVDYLPIWQADVRRAVQWLIKHCAVENVALCGVRFGAMLANMIAASDASIKALVLLAPVLRGRSHIRQLRADGYWSVGAALSAQDIDTLNALDLKTLPPRCRTIMFAQSMSSQSVTDCVTQWRQKDVAVDLADFAKMDAMIRPTFANHDTAAEISPILAWIAQVCPDLPQPAYFDVPDYMPITSSQWHETPMFFGKHQKQVGVLCRPSHEVGETVILLCNSSADPHSASNKVNLARHLAAKGMSTFRFDFHGVGDSLMAGDQTHVFEVDRVDDFGDAIDALIPFGFVNFATEGLCSGAYHAYHAAMTDPRIGYALLINLPFFEWMPGVKVEDLVFHDRTPSQFAREVRTKAFWHEQWRKIKNRDFHIITNRFIGIKRWLGKVPGFTKSGAARVIRHDVKMLFLASEGDISISAVQREFGTRVPDGIEMKVLDGLDHSMHRQAMASVVASEFLQFLDRVDKSTVHVSPNKGVRRVSRPFSLVN